MIVEMIVAAEKLMNERQLRIFYEVATKLSMTESANALFVTQPAISQTIKELEKEYCVKFFDRIGKKLYLTSDGETFLQYVRRILNLYDECNKTIKNSKDLKSGQLKIGASTTIGIYILTDIIGKYTKLHKGIDVSIIIENTQNISNLILENKIDFAFVEGPVHSDEIVVKEFCDDELVIITSPEHHWASLKEIDIKEIEQEKIIMREQGSGTREIFEKLLISQNINLKSSLELGNTEAIKKAVEAGLGISCISKRAVQRENEYGKLAIVDLNGIKITRKLNLIFHKDKNISNLFSSFIEYCKQEV